MKGDSKRIVELSLARLDAIEHSAYMEGWRWGVAGGFIVGLFTAALGAWLLHQFAAAWVV